MTTPHGYPLVNSKLAHRVRAERALGKPLPPGACVHHADGTKSIDAPLVICQDQAYHSLLHIRMRVIKAGGDPNRQRICTDCKQLKFMEEMAKAGIRKGHSGTLAGHCKACTTIRAGRWYARTRAKKASTKQRWAV